MHLLEEDRFKLRRLLDLWDYLVDPKVGVIHDVYELPIDDDDPNFFHFLSTSCDTSRFTPLRNFRNNGGVSTNRYVGIAKAMGEAIERYCSAFFDYDDLVVASYESLTEKATPPDAYSLYRPEQFERPDMPWEPFNPSTKIGWTRGVSLLMDDAVLVPAAMIYIPYHYIKTRGDAPIVQPISTGLALGSSYYEAVLGGICEVVERDAFTVTWQARLIRPRIPLESLPSSCRDRVARFTKVGIDVEIIDITSDISFPTMLTIALGHSITSPAVAVAAATDPSAEVAVIKSLEELAHTRKFAKQLMEYTPEIPVEPDRGHPKVQDQKDHLRFYCPQHAKRFAEFAWSSPETRDFAEIGDHSDKDEKGSLAVALRDIAAAGMDVIACNLTTPDIATLGLQCVRIVIPGMNPLYMGYQNRALGGKRLYQIPKKLGYSELTPGQPDNLYPHPFP